MIRLDSGVLLFEHDDWKPINRVMGNSMNLPVSEVIVHHSYIPNVLCGDTVAREIESMRGMDRYATVDQKWGGFSYSYAIYQSGHAYVGRGYARTGAHTVGRNSKSIGICFVTDGSVHELTAAAIAAFTSVISYLIREFALTADYTISPHDLYKNKVCPGAKIKAQLPELLGRVERRWPTLRLGSRGEVVEYLQKFLMDRGHMWRGHPLGYFGNHTETAVKAFQQAEGLVADGIVGPNTWSKIP